MAQSLVKDLIDEKSLRRTETFVTDGTRFMVFPDRVAKVIEIADKAEQARISPDVHMIENHGAIYLGDVAGRPCVWREAGIVPINKQPTTDTTLTLTASQSEVFNVEIFGMVRDASESGSSLELFRVRETVAVTDDTDNITSNSWVDVTSISKDRSTDAYIQVTDDVSGKVVSRIMGPDANPAYRRIEFETVPGAGRQVVVEYFTHPDRIDSELQPVDPALNLDYLVWMAVGDLHWLLKETQNAQVAWARAEEILAEEANKERTFGENSESITPDFTYFELEDSDGYI
jgi:hypothetical protein